MDTTDISHLEERCISSELIYDGQVVHLYVDRVSLPNGEDSVREYVKHIGAVAVLPLTDEGDVICVRQFRYAHGCVLTEILSSDGLVRFLVMISMNLKKRE